MPHSGLCGDALRQAVAAMDALVPMPAGPTRIRVALESCPRVSPMGRRSCAVRRLSCTFHACGLPDSGIRRLLRRIRAPAWLANTETRRRNDHRLLHAGGSPGCDAVRDHPPGARIRGSATVVDDCHRNHHVRSDVGESRRTPMAIESLVPSSVWPTCEAGQRW